MSRRTIPAQTIVSCDCCSDVLVKDNHREEGGLILKATALDMHGHGMGDAGFQMDLCDRCLGRVKKAIDIVRRGETPLCAPSLMTVANAPKVLNANDKAMWVVGWNECAQGGFKG